GECALSLFDNFSPRYQYRFTPGEVRQMLQAAGLMEIRDTTLANEGRHMVAFTARVPAEPRWATADSFEPASTRAAHTTIGSRHDPHH
ncbi:MAG: hypothetical protein JO081_04120, partial [Alphaproteobacteria bacterium]|nr:hypothetical protein [Alphaproteobacteria bacterium]